MNKQAIKAKLDEAAKTVQGDGTGFSFESLWTVIESVLQDGQVTADDFQPILLYAEELFDEFVVPYNIPKVPAFLESIIEKRVLRPMIRIGLELLFDTYFKEEE
jgi:hypothetical protein